MALSLRQFLIVKLTLMGFQIHDVKFFFFIFLFLFLSPFNSLSDHCYVLAHYNTFLVFMSHSHYTAMQELQIVNMIITDSNCIVSVMIHLYKFHFLYFSESFTPYYLLFPNFIFHPLLSRKCVIICLLCFSLIIFTPTLVQFNLIYLMTLLL